MVMHELRVESLKARVEIQKYEFKSTSYNFKSTSYEFKSTSCEFESTTYELLEIVRQFVRQLIRSVSGDNFLFQVSTTLKEETSILH